MFSNSFSEVLQWLETWHVIPCPSPVHSKDTDTASDRPEQARHHKLGVQCHHGETSHISEISLADILSDSTPIQKYQQDKQPHEELAYKLQLPTIDDSNLDDTRSVYLFLSFNIPLQSPLLPSQRGMTNSPNSSPDDELTKMLEQIKSERERMRSSTARFARGMRIRKRPNGVKK
jgi:hypothetical protein